ncbi:MAG TPA: poly-gamma-glutamate hydrolase family protein, partial [Acidimicrobiales bacterium]|nr:poly-gamma-glutamate hydrolase family protein [Acidimicrobiales bacterium]
HGGLEGGTDAIASAAARAAGASLYLVVQPPTVRWHIPSHQVDPAESATLAAFLAHVEVAVAVHGYGRPDRQRDILLGGGNRPLAGALARALRDGTEGFCVVDDLAAIPETMRGLHPANPVNRPAGGGVQLELPPLARGTRGHWTDTSGRCRPVAGLVEALVSTALHYTSGPGYAQGFIAPTP